jgi:hypothetical protein
VRQLGTRLSTAVQFALFYRKRYGLLIWLLVLDVFLVLGMICFITVGVDGWRAHHGGIRGTVTVARCKARHPWRANGGWSCSGSFVSNDRSVRIAHLWLEDDGHRLAGEEVSAAVIGPASRDAWSISDTTWWILPMLGFGACAGVGALHIRIVAAETSVIRFERRRRRAEARTETKIDLRTPNRRNRRRKSRKRR